jgi:uncharacterized small protein (DUF1192 family)
MKDYNYYSSYGVNELIEEILKLNKELEKLKRELEKTK